MSSTKAVGPATIAGPRSLATVLLSRRGTVYLPTPAVVTDPAGDSGAALIEADLINRGYLLAPPLRAAFAALDARAMGAVGRALLHDIDRALGADRPHVPLLRDFPDSTPRDTSAHYADRVLTVLFQRPEQPCVLCGTVDSVVPVSPCAHLVCGSCFDGADFSACPVCERRIDPADPFLSPKRPRRSMFRRAAPPERLRLLSYGGDFAARQADAAGELDTLLSRTGALSPQDTDDLETLLAARTRDDLDDLARLPATVPGRETKARLVAWLLADPAAVPATLPVATGLIDTATDVLRVLVVRSGGDAGLVEIPRFAPVPRPLRRALLSVFDTLNPAQAAQDMRRHRRAWIHAAELLHPFEHTGRFPRAALAFAALRGTRLGDDALSAALRAAAETADDIDVTGPAVTAYSWSGQVEAALAARDLAGALTLLEQRPGELVRRLDHLLRLIGEENQENEGDEDTSVVSVVSALERVVPRVAPAVLLSALGAIRTRTRQRAARVFFPKGAMAKTHVIDDDRPALPAALVRMVADVLTAELLRRAGTGAPVEVAVVDAALDGVVAPFTERTASRALVTLPRGSELAVPDGRTLRLFLHWMESPTSGRTDLDLSAAMFDADWRQVGVCDYTSLRFASQAAVHSGDLQDAPPPLGASEFVDLDLERLGAAGVRYVVAVVYSYNNVPFGDLAEAFAGLMLRDGPGNRGPVFDPRSVEQRFDLTGSSRACVPLLIDVRARTMRWFDVVKGVTGTHHAVWRHADALATLAHRLTDLFASGSRVGLGELAVWQAAARAATVVLRHTDGSRSVYRRRDGEDVGGFAARIGSPETDTDAPEGVGGEGDGPSAGPRLAYVLRGDLELPEGSEVFALYPLGQDAARVRLLAAADMVTALAPR
ncbi:MXAN_6230/SCO0854 family RING domain-containing protein [Streptomyces sp. NPDC052236]|uniref:MXAN_6230/SCO0854 family RING domain-containing protein n=1 Tax=Streptomyces sp. NPDC052236 TaxID=3365686 RepID=UPI0037D2E2EF